MTERYFTLEEAQEIIPWVQSAFDSIHELSSKGIESRKTASALVEKMQSNGGSQHDEELNALQTSVQQSTTAIQSTLDEFASRGIIVRDVQRGLIDLPSLREGREVYLCWVDRETTIEFWHEVDTGFPGRQPL
jgi:hypothetical protein